MIYLATIAPNGCDGLRHTMLWPINGSDCVGLYLECPLASGIFLIELKWCQACIGEYMVHVVPVKTPVYWWAHELFKLKVPLGVVNCNC